jgi:Flp pilus assembly pilin Flp
MGLSPAGVHRRAVRRTTYVYYVKDGMVDAPSDPYLPQVTSPRERSGASDGWEGGRVLLSLATRVQVFWSGLRGRFAGEKGAVATEYVLLLIFIAAVIIGAVMAFGITLGGKYKEVCDTVC